MYFSSEDNETVVVKNPERRIHITFTCESSFLPGTFHVLCVLFLSVSSFICTILIYLCTYVQCMCMYMYVLLCLGGQNFRGIQ